ncbi:uncharacterized protein LOC113295780 [Papaver somniferum]|uniref:uncharacterized protein LOC113295780 n=1 Tax=Papaver somniferum TaxID=3469 RepID=UPI000E6F5101|nr:uncharacterized protein LOC113295780 [Papaver somniferum]
MILDNAPENEKMIAHDIQKDIASAISFGIISSITKEIGDGLFSLLVDESRDISSKEQMAIVLRYVKDGCVIERFVGIKHVSYTTGLSLNLQSMIFFSRHGLSISKVRGQGYDGESNMQGEYNGLKTLVLNENSSAYSVYCFSHQLQLAVRAVSKKHTYVEDLFLLVTNIVTVVEGSTKRQDLILEKQATLVYEAIDRGELSTWQVDVLDTLAHHSDKKFEARLTLDEKYNGYHGRFVASFVEERSRYCECHETVYHMQATIAKDGWESLLPQVSSFCEKHEIEVLNMEDMFCFPRKSKRLAPHITNLHHYRVEFFYEVINMQLLELNYRFSETTTELFLCVASLSPIDSFSAFDKQKLVCLAQLYPSDFSAVELGILEDQLETYIVVMRSSGDFWG